MLRYAAWADVRIILQIMVVELFLFGATFVFPNYFGTGVIATLDVCFDTLCVRAGADQHQLLFANHRSRAGTSP
jgi:hypothetical protein